MDKERWKNIEGYSGLYMISDHGRVKSLKKLGNSKERILVPLKGEYLAVRLLKDNTGSTFKVHRLVAKHFVTEGSGNQVNHIDGVKYNNVYTNLEWCTDSDNRKHAYRIGLKSGKGEKNGNAKLTEAQVSEIRGMRDIRVAKAVALLYGVDPNHIRAIWRGLRW